MYTTTLAISIGTLLLIATGAQAAPLGLRPIAAAGSGCNAGSVDGELVDATTINLSMDALVADTSSGPSSLRSNCTLILGFVAPHQQVAIESIAADYVAALSAGITGRVSASVHVQGSAQDGAFTGIDVAASTDGAHGSLGNEGLVWTPCGAGRSLVLSLESVLPFSRSDALVTVQPLAIKIVSRTCNH